MDRIERDTMIKALAQIKPRYVQNYDDFKEGDPVYYSGPFYNYRENEMAMECLLTGKWLTAGPYVERFQNAFAKKFNVSHAHMVNSGSSANLIMIAALKKHHGWQDGDEIIVSPVGFPTTIAPIVQNGLKPVFVDIEMLTLNFNLADIVSKFDNLNGRIKAIFVSPVLGNPPDMDYLESIARTFGVELIGDNCDSLGSRWDGKLLNQYYTAWSCSFYPAHHISTGEGGMVCTYDPDLLTLIRSFSWWGKACYCVGSANLMTCGTCGKRFSNWLDGYDGPVDHRFTFDNMGYNLKPIDIQGAFGLAQLEKFDEIEFKRQVNHDYIADIVTQIKGVTTAVTLNKARPSWFGVPFICSSKELKEKLQAHFETNKIQTRPYFAGNILMHQGYKHLDDFSKYPNSNKVLDKVFFLGCPPMFNQLVMDYIKKVVNRFEP